MKPRDLATADSRQQDITERTRCFRCFRPVDRCFCRSIPSIANRTDVLLVQHRRERFHAFNTARIVYQALQSCTLLTDHSDPLAKRFETISLSAKAGLLFPGPDAMLLSDLDPSDYPDQLVILDGTWSQAKTLLRSMPRLRQLPQYSLAPQSPGRYRIRREPNDHAISTVEATVAALRVLEPDTTGLDQLIGAFDQMIDDQISRSPTQLQPNWRLNKKRRRGVTNVPRSLAGDLSNIVVAYGEMSQGGRSRQQDGNHLPVYWVAERLISGETFQCAIESDAATDGDHLKHLRLQTVDFQDAVSIDVFQARWRAFLRPNDEVAVFRSSTAKLLGNIDSALTPSLVLRSVNLGHQSLQGSQDDIAAALTISAETAGVSRASQRLAFAVKFAHYLSSLGG